jgi:hypothetical protein
VRARGPRDERTSIGRMVRSRSQGATTTITAVLIPHCPPPGRTSRRVHLTSPTSRTARAGPCSPVAALTTAPVTGRAPTPRISRTRTARAVRNALGPWRVASRGTSSNAALERSGLGSRAVHRSSRTSRTRTARAPRLPALG